MPLPKHVLNPPFSVVRASHTSKTPMWSRWKVKNSAPTWVRLISFLPMCWPTLVRKNGVACVHPDPTAPFGCHTWWTWW